MDLSLDQCPSWPEMLCTQSRGSSHKMGLVPDSDSDVDIWFCFKKRGTDKAVPKLQTPSLKVGPWEGRSACNNVALAFQILNRLVAGMCPPSFFVLRK